jgi:hypothetical protein
LHFIKAISIPGQSIDRYYGTLIVKVIGMHAKLYRRFAPEKDEHQFVSVKEFCDDMNFSMEEIAKFICD